MSLFRRSPGEGNRWIVAGLGNPGERYAKTRHNAGALALEELLQRSGATLRSHKSGCLIAETRIAGEAVVLARPTSYMNESGRQLGALMRFFKVESSSLVVVHDEIDIPFGEIRIKFGGGTAGHNGLKSIVNHVGSKDFVRVRLGVGRPRGASGAADHVLDGFSAAERKALPFLLSDGADAVERIVTAGVERAMNEVNTRDKVPPGS